VTRSTPDAPEFFKKPLKYFFVPFPPEMILHTFPVLMKIGEEEVVHYMGTVCRVKKGQSLVLVNATEQTAYEAIVLEVDKKQITVHLQQRLQKNNPQPVPGSRLGAQITLAVCLIRETPWSWMLQKATELGVTHIQPLISDRTTIQVSSKEAHKKQKRWQSVVQSAAEQSEGLFLPVVHPPLSFATWLSTINTQENLCCFFHERGEGRTPLFRFLNTKLSSESPRQSLIIAIGPEGGWSEEEVAAFHAKNLLPLQLGSRILRAETAGLLALGSILLYLESL
jgi:16S rRNA (uracil1498-N3)-methyltransferase